MTQSGQNKHKNIQANVANFQSKRKFPKMTQTSNVIDAQRKKGKDQSKMK